MQLIQDVRYALRSLWKRPGFTLIAVVTLALGIGASTAIFSVVHAVLLRSLPYGSADRLVMVWEDTHRTGGRANNVINLGNFYDWKDQNHSLEDMAAFFYQSVKLTSDGEPAEIPAQIATPNLFLLLRGNPIKGRTVSQ